MVIVSLKALVLLLQVQWITVAALAFAVVVLGNLFHLQEPRIMRPMVHCQHRLVSTE